jgi:hypothetical protein
VAKAKKRNIAAVSTNNEEDHADNNNEGKEEPVTSNGVRFGSGAYSSDGRVAKARKPGSS